MIMLFLWLLACMHGAGCMEMEAGGKAGVEAELLMCASKPPVKIAKFKDMMESNLIRSKDDFQSRELYLLHPRPKLMVEAFEVTVQLLTEQDPVELLKSCASFFDNPALAESLLFVKYETVLNQFTIRTLESPTASRILDSLHLSPSQDTTVIKLSVPILDDFDPREEGSLVNVIHFARKDASSESTAFRSYHNPAFSYLFLNNVNFGSFIDNCRIIISHDRCEVTPPNDLVHLKVCMSGPQNQTIRSVRLLFFRSIENILKMVFSGKSYWGASFFPKLELLREMIVEPSDRKRYIRGLPTTVYQLKLSFQNDIDEDSLRVLRVHLKCILMAGVIPSIAHGDPIQIPPSPCLLSGDYGGLNIEFPIKNLSEFLLAVPKFLKFEDLGSVAQPSLKLENLAAVRGGFMGSISYDVRCTDRRRISFALMRLYELVAKFNLSNHLGTASFTPAGKYRFTIILFVYNPTMDGLHKLLRKLRGIVGLIYEGVGMEVKNELYLNGAPEFESSDEFDYYYFDEVQVIKTAKKRPVKAKAVKTDRVMGWREVAKQNAARLRTLRKQEESAKKLQAKDEQMADHPQQIQPEQPQSIQDHNEHVKGISEEENFIMEGRPKISVFQGKELVEFEIPDSESYSSEA